MTDYALQIDSPYTYIWHDNGGQTVPFSNQQVQASVSVDGLSINIPDNVIVTEPIVIINSAATGNTSKNRINIGKSAQAQIVEYLLCDDQNGSNIVSTQINCAANSNLNHCIIEYAHSSANIKQSATTEIVQQQDSRARSNLFSFGGGRSHLALRMVLAGKYAQSAASSLAYTIGSEIQEVVLKIEHQAQHCNSNTVTRNVLKDNSQTDLAGRIIVHPGASKTMAELQIRNLLCSAKAQAINKPELEIFNDDVRCTHGSSSGQLDEDALFYIRSRGLDLAEATALLISGFIQPVIANCEITQVVNYINNLLKDR